MFAACRWVYDANPASSPPVVSYTCDCPVLLTCQILFPLALLNDPVPITSSVFTGLAVPIPTLPLDSVMTESPTSPFGPFSHLVIRPVVPTPLMLGANLRPISGPTALSP